MAFTKKYIPVKINKQKKRWWHPELYSCRIILLWQTRKKIYEIKYKLNFQIRLKSFFCEETNVNIAVTGQAFKRGSNIIHHVLFRNQVGHFTQRFCYVETDIGDVVFVKVANSSNTKFRNFILIKYRLT